MLYERAKAEYTVIGRYCGHAAFALQNAGKIYGGASGVRQILVDKETGVNYLLWSTGYAGGITPLLDSYGNVVITK